MKVSSYDLDQTVPTGIRDVMTTEAIPANPKVIKEALELSEKILTDIEAVEIPLSRVALKTRRLARILKETDYPEILDDIESIEALERDLQTNISELEKIPEPDLDLGPIAAAFWESSRAGVRKNILKHEISKLRQVLASKKIFVYDYISKKYYELKFSGLAEDAFSRIRESVDNSIGSLVPTGDQKVMSIYKNLESDSSEDWSNAVHSCRRVLTDLADAVFPPQVEPRYKNLNGKEIKIKLEQENYKNRLICFVEDHNDSERFEDLVGSHLKFLEDRLESVIEAANKGTHSIITREEADRYVVYTYMIVGDILSLWMEKQQTPEKLS
jgi:hypothetical protein